jgi:fermentation-respiration switch protein FrsA (DUF1100 family)
VSNGGGIVPRLSRIVQQGGQVKNGDKFESTNHEKTCLSRAVAFERLRTGWLEQYGTPEQNPAFWKAVSANSYLSDLSGPIQLHHGTADGDVPVAFSETLYGQIRAAGQYAENCTPIRATITTSLPLSTQP